MSFYNPASNDHLILEDLSSILLSVCLSFEFIVMHPTTLFDSEKCIVV